MTASASPAADDAPGVHLSGETLMGLRHLARRGVSPATRTLQGLPGGIVTKKRGRGSEPDDVRLWSEGDDMRFIDRNATARTGELHVRTHHDERDRAVALLADFRPSMLFGTRRALRSVAAAEALALLGWRVVGDGGRVGLIVASPSEPTVIRPAGGERAMTAVTGAMAHAHAQALAASAQKADPPLSSMLPLARSLLPSGGHLVIASALDSPGEDFDSLLTVLAERLSVRLLLVSDAFERVRMPGFYPFATPDGHRGTVQTTRAETSTQGSDARLAEMHRRGIEGLRIEVEAGPEAYAPLMERLDAVL